MDKIKILYIITKLELGGAQKHLLDLIDNLDKEKYSIFLISAKEGLLLEEAKKLKGVSFRGSHFLGRVINPVQDVFSLFEIYFYILKHRVDIVHTHSSKAGIVGRFAAILARTKIIIHTVHGWSFNDYQSALVKSFYIHLERLASRFTDKIIVVSEVDKIKGLKHEIGRADKYEIIYYGIKKDAFGVTDQKVIEDFCIRKEKDIVVGTISCFKPQKCLSDFIRFCVMIADKFSNAKFLLIGDGEERPQIESLINKSGLSGRVILTGWRNDIPSLISLMDVFVLTSLWEGLPISVLEAMASAKPVVLTNTGGVSEVVIDKKNGFLVPLRDINAMFDRVSSLLSDKQFRLDIGKAGAETLGQRFTTEYMVNCTSKLYSKEIVRYGSLH